MREKNPRICRSPYFTRRKKRVTTPKIVTEAGCSLVSSQPQETPVFNPVTLKKEGKLTIPNGSRGLHQLRNYIPPKSPHNLIQESLFHDPWLLLVCTILLNRTSGKAAIPIFWEFARRWPNPERALKGNKDEMAELLQPLGLNKKRTTIIKRFSDEYLHKDWLLASDLYGIGKYGNDSYRIFCLGDWQSVEPNDRKLNLYHSWLIQKNSNT